MKKCDNPCMNARRQDIIWRRCAMQQNAGTVICLLMKINALKHVSGPDIAECCFDKEKRYEGTVWVRFKS